MSKIRIAYLIDTIYSETAGTEKQLMGIIERLDRDIFEPYLICMRSSLWMKKNKLPCEVFVLDYNGFIKPSFMRVVKRFLDLLRDKQFHIIQTFFKDSIFVGYLGKLLSPTKPVLLSSRRDIGLGSEEPWYHRIYKVVLPIVNKHFERIVANGENVRDHVAKTEKVPLSKILLIHNGIAISDHAESKPAVFEDIQAKLWIGIVANLKPVKRIDVFLKGIAHLKAICNNIDFKALVLGEGVERERLQDIAREFNLLSTVQFMGEVTNVTAYLQNIDIGVLCSDREGFPNSILEYMACGLPVVATAVGGNTELVDDTNGFCVPPGNPVALAECLVRLVLSSELRKRMGYRSLERVKHCFSWDRIINEWQSHYMSLLGKRDLTSMSCR